MGYSGAFEPPPFNFVYSPARSGCDTRAGRMRVCAWMYLFNAGGNSDGGGGDKVQTGKWLPANCFARIIFKLRISR